MTELPAKDGQIDHEKLIRQFEESFDQTQDARKDAEQARDYYDGKQLTPEELQALAQRKQPPVISNRIKPKIDALLGFEKKQRTDPKAYPRTPKHEAEAEGATDAIRFVCDQNRFQAIRSEAAESMLIEGIGAATVTAAKAKDGQIDVKLNHVPWDRFYFDPHSRKRDFSDAAYVGVVLWMDEEDALADFGDKAQVLAACYENADKDTTYGDRPKLQWGDQKRKRVRVLQPRWREKGVWMTATVCKGGYLRDPQKSPYLDENGTPECDLIAVSAFVDRENNRYGAVRTMISPQDEINKRRSKALHLLNARPVIAEKGAVENVEQARREINRPDGYVEVNGDMRFEVIENQALVSGQFELLQESKAEIDASGVNPAIEGDLQAPSGRAQELITQAGLAEQAIAFDALRDWSWRVYRAAWHRIRQYWKEERWVRVTDDERNLKWVGINRPVTAGEEQLKQAQAQGAPPEVLQQMQQQFAADPMMQRVARIENGLAELDVDLILEDGPDTLTIQSEQYGQLVELKKADPNSIPSEAIIEASSLRNKDAILEKMKQRGIPPELQKQMEEQQKALQDCQQQLQQAQQKLADKGLDAQKAQADAQDKSADRDLEWFKARTERIAAIQKNAVAAGQLDQAAAAELIQHINAGIDRQHQFAMQQNAQEFQASQPQPGGNA
jgi:hypothetical protein